MLEWEISDQDISTVEKLLLPDGAQFQQDAREVIRCWHSTDVSACPGSGKTTVLLAKLKILADRMPLEGGAGICVLSHTNIAVDEIKRRLSNYADKLLSYPNYVGTIQSFVDRFVSLPYLRACFGQNVHVVDDLTYAQHMLNEIKNTIKYNGFYYLVKFKSKNISGDETSVQINYLKSLFIGDDGALYTKGQKKALAGAERDSTKQFKELVDDLLKYEGIIRYGDAYSYAKTAIEHLPEDYKDIFSLRFRYVFIDEYQDCDDIQRQVIDSIFESEKCVVFKIGDSDQAIYSSDAASTSDWMPQKDFLPIMTSCRYSQEIAKVICKLKKDSKNITTLIGETGIKPVLLVFPPEKINGVISAFISILEKKGLYDNNGVYKAIGAIKNESSSGLKIGSYWAEFDSSAKNKSEYNYWFFIDEIIDYLSKGKLYKAEQIVRKLLCRMFHYAKIKNSISGKDYTIVTMKKALDEKYRGIYCQWIYEMSRLQNIDRKSVDKMLRQKINELLSINSPCTNIFTRLPSYFLNEGAVAKKTNKPDKNIFVDPIRGRKIIFTTIHAVKGETHDATLYLETDRNKASDLSRILYCYGIGKQGNSSLYDYSRKLAYVGMSRPKKLLCVAMQDKTYNKSKGIFDTDWEVIHLKD